MSGIRNPQPISAIDDVTKGQVNPGDDADQALRVKVVATTPGAAQDVNLIEVGGTAVDVGQGSTSGGTQRVVLANDNPALDVATANITDIDGNRIDVDAGFVSVGTQRVVLATDQPQVAVVVEEVIPGTGDNNLGVLEAQSINNPKTGVLILGRSSGDNTARAFESIAGGGATARSMLVALGGCAATPSTFVSAASGTSVQMSSTNAPIKACSMQVVATGAVTSWTVVLEGSLDTVNYFTLATISNVDGSGAIKGFSSFPVVSIRPRCSAIVLGGGTNVVATVIGSA